MIGIILGLIVGILIGEAWAADVSRGISPNGLPLQLRMTGDGMVAAQCAVMSPSALEQIAAILGKK